MTSTHAAVGVLLGFAAGVMSGLFGVGGGIITTPGIQLLLGGAPYIAVGTPLPVIVPTALVASHRVAVHRRLGVAGALLAAAMILAGTSVAIAAAKGGSAPRPAGPVRTRPVRSASRARRRVEGVGKPG